MNELSIICFDFETGGLDSKKNPVLEIAGKAYRADNLEPFPISEGGEFGPILLKPLATDLVEDGALKVNKITREELATAANQDVVWLSFVEWVNRFNVKKTKYGAPIAAGKNIRNFDLLFAEELNKRHSPKKEKTLLFNHTYQLDLQDFLFVWFEHDSSLPSFKMDDIRPYFGLTSEGAHSAMVDVQQTGLLIMKFLKLHRDLKSRKASNGNNLIQFQGSCKN